MNKLAENMNRRHRAQQLLALLAMQGCAGPGRLHGPDIHAHARQLLAPRAMPFTLGIASGSIGPEHVILWTRLLPEGAAHDTLSASDLTARWEMASDEGFRSIIQEGTVRALAARAHCVHVKVNGLKADRPYFFRFHSGAFTSGTGRTRTSPSADAKVSSLKLAFASCQHWEYGYFGAYRDLAMQQPDLVLFLGDYIYEGGPYTGPGQRARRHDGPAARTLGQYRARYALYKSDPDLQGAHAAAPWVNIWDDHEVENDYAGLSARDRDASFAIRRLAAYRAWAEHMPVDFEAMFGQVSASDTRIYSHLDWGSLARIHLLDTRQYRHVQACVPPGRSGAFAEASCPERHDPARSMLGHAQEKWLQQSLGSSHAAWNVVAQQTLVTSLTPPHEASPGEKVWMDGWDGYLPAKKRFLQGLAQPGVRNPVVIGGDVHSEWACDLRLDPDRQDARKIAAEVCGTSITSSSGITQKQAERAMREHPDVRYGRADKRGYNLMDISGSQCRVTFRASEEVLTRTSEVSALARFLIEDGRPGIAAVSS